MCYFKNINAFLVYTICFNETVHDNWCLDKSVRQTENDLERGFVKHWLNSVNRPWDSKVARKRDSRHHSTTSISENVVIAETSYQMLEVLSF